MKKIVLFIIVVLFLIGGAPSIIKAESYCGDGYDKSEMRIPGEVLVCVTTRSSDFTISLSNLSTKKVKYAQGTGWASQGGGLVVSVKPECANDEIKVSTDPLVCAYVEGPGE